MTAEFESWMKVFISDVNKVLSPFTPRSSATGTNDNWRRYYVDGRDNQEHFVCHLRPVPTKSRMNVMVGLPETRLKIPEGGPQLELRDKSVPQYREFEVDFGDERIKGIALDLVLQVAASHARKKK